MIMIRILHLNYGYIQSVSDVKKSRSSSATYFDGMIQTSKDSSMRFISFTPEKLNAFQTAYNMTSPVRITSQTITPSKGTNEVTVERRTELTVVQKILEFAIKPLTKAPTATDKTVNEVTEPSMLVS